MDHFSNVASIKLPDHGLHSGSVALSEHSFQFYGSEQQSTYQGTYQGMSVQKMDSPFPVCNRQLNIQQSNPYPVNSLSEYHILSHTNTNPANYSGTEIPRIPQSILDEFVPWDSGNEPINYEQPSIANNHCGQQTDLSGSEIANMEQIQASMKKQQTSHWNPHDQPTNVSSGFFNPMDVQPVAVVNPLSLYQTTSDNHTTPIEAIADGSLVDHQRERRQYAKKRKLKTERQRLQRKDPERRKLINQYQRERMKDPERRKLKNQRERERYHQMMQDPEKWNRRKNQKKQYDRERHSLRMQTRNKES